MTYAARVTFRLEHVGSLQSDESRVEFLPNGSGTAHRIISGNRDLSIGRVDRLSLISPSHESEEQAVKASEAVIDSLLVYAVQRSRAIDLGHCTHAECRIYSAGEEEFKRIFGAQRILADNLGTTIFAENPKPTFVSVRATPHVSASLETLTEFLKDNLYRITFESEKSRNAAYLFTLVHFQVSPVAQFLLLFISIEALLSPGPASPSVASHADSLIELTRNSALPKEEIETLCSSLSFMKRESIARTARTLAATRLLGKTYMDLSPDEFFKRIYRTRNNIVHRGNVDNKELSTLHEHLNKFAIDLILSHVRTS